MRIHCIVRPQCNAYPLYCARNKKASALLGRSTYMFEAIVSQAQFAICLREKNVWYRSMFLLRSSGEATYWNVCRSPWLCLANQCLDIRLSHTILYGWWLLEDGNITECSYRGVWTWYWGKIISPEMKSRDLYSSRNIISNPKILGTFRGCSRQQSRHLFILYGYPLPCPGFGIARRNLQNSVFFSAGISFKLCAVQCVSIVLCAAVQRVSIVLCAQ